MEQPWVETAEVDFGTVVTRKLSIDDIQKVREKVWRVRVKWYDVGIELGLAVDDLDVISEHNRDKPDKCVTEMLITWFRGGKATWKALITALKRPPFDYVDLANFIEYSLGYRAPAVTTKAVCVSV